MIEHQINDRKQVQLAYCIFQKTGAFRDTLKTWNAKATEDKTYEDFKTFMREEHAELDAVDGLDIQRSNINQASIIRSLQEHQDSLSHRLEEQMKINFIEALTT